MASIPTTNVAGQQTISLGAINQPFTWAKLTINRTGTGGTNPWLNSLTSADSLGVEFQYSTDSGQNWHGLGVDALMGGSHLVRGVQVPETNTIGVGIGVLFSTGTQFRVTLTASTPVTFDGLASFG